MGSLADTFTNTDGTDLFAHSGGGFSWIKVFDSTNATVADINTNRARFTGPDSQHHAALTPASFSTNDQWAEVSYTSLAGAPGVFVRGSWTGDSSPSYDAYRAEHYPDGKVYLSRVSLLYRSVVYLNGGAGVTVTGTGTLRVEANGSTIRVLFNGVEKISVTDTSVTAGKRCGIWVFPTSGNDAIVDDFSARDANITEATSYTFTGPVIGANNTESTDFTISPVGGDWPTGQTVSLATTGAGTFSDSNPIALSGGNPITVTYTPTSLVGSPHVLSITASPALGTNPASINYEVVGYTTVTTTSPNGQSITVLVPQSYSATAGAHIVLYAHGNNGTHTEVASRTSVDRAAFLDELIDAGYIVAGSNLNGNNWGNSASLASMVDLYAYLVTNYRCRSTLLWGTSMGGLSSLLAIADDRIPRVKGWLGILPVCDLANMFGGNSGTYAAGIRTAYGIAANGSDYATLTDGHDPVLLEDVSAFANIGFMSISSPDDTVVDEAENSTAMHALVASVVFENNHLHTTGDHGSLNSYAVMLANAPAFFTRCLAIPEGTGGTNTGLWFRLQELAIGDGLELSRP